MPFYNILYKDITQFYVFVEELERAILSLVMKILNIQDKWAFNFSGSIKPFLVIVCLL